MKCEIVSVSYENGHVVLELACDIDYIDNENEGL
jgi:hypothetical protein